MLELKYTCRKRQSRPGSTVNCRHIFITIITITIINMVRNNFPANHTQVCNFAYIESSGCQKVIFRVAPVKFVSVIFFGKSKCVAWSNARQPTNVKSIQVVISPHTSSSADRTPIVLGFAEIKIPTTYWGDQGSTLTYCQNQGCLGFLCCSIGLLLCNFKKSFLPGMQSILTLE